LAQSRPLNREVGRTVRSGNAAWENYNNPTPHTPAPPILQADVETLSNDYAVRFTVWAFIEMVQAAPVGQVVVHFWTGSVCEYSHSAAVRVGEECVARVLPCFPLYLMSFLD